MYDALLRGMQPGSVIYECVYERGNKKGMRKSIYDGSGPDMNDPELNDMDLQHKLIH